MPRFSVSATATALALILAGTPLLAQDDAVDIDTVVATVNGQDITIGHVLSARASLPQQYQELPDDVLFEGIVDQMVQQALLSQQVDGDLPDRVRFALDNERRLLLAGEAVEDIIDTAVTDDALRAAYEARYAEEAPGMEYNASHILVETEEEAQSLVEQLDDGADFAELAKEHSTGPSGPSGGELGWFGAGAMVAPFEDAVKELDEGSVSAPVQTQFGWHVIKLNETRAAEAPELDEVREELAEEIRTSAVQERLDAMMDEATIDNRSDEIDPAVLSRPDLLEN
ncbi:MAG: peptidylprolyl isomerase [Paracoccaceae bacterium]